MPALGQRKNLQRTTGIFAIALAVAIAGCNQTTEPEQPSGEGTLEFRANGEDFVRQGFVSKDGWEIEFDHVYVNLTDLTAYQAEASFDPDTSTEVPAKATVKLPGAHTVDLAAGDAEVAPILIGETEAPAGRYNALKWSMQPANDGPAAGSVLMLVGTATKDDRTIQFSLKFDQPATYLCGAYVGEERKGFLDAEGTAEVEATFHFDHIFGDGSFPEDDGINTGALGFEPLTPLAEGDTIDADIVSMKQLTTSDFLTLKETLNGLAHVGEGHCRQVTDAS